MNHLLHVAGSHRAVGKRPDAITAKKLTLVPRGGIDRKL